MNQQLPSKKRIAEAWSLAYGFDPPWGTIANWDEPECWACNYYSESWNGLDRCHVIPRSLGGSCDPLNLVVMCSRCHEDSPDHADSRYLFRWMNERPKRDMWNWLPAHLDEMKRLTSLALERNWTQETLSLIVKDFVAGSGTHFGRSSDGTRQALLWRLADSIEETR